MNCLSRDKPARNLQKDVLSMKGDLKPSILCIHSFCAAAAARRCDCFYTYICMSGRLLFDRQFRFFRCQRPVAPLVALLLQRQQLVRPS